MHCSLLAPSRSSKAVQLSFWKHPFATPLLCNFTYFYVLLPLPLSSIFTTLLSFSCSLILDRSCFSRPSIVYTSAFVFSHLSRPQHFSGHDHPHDFSRSFASDCLEHAETKNLLKILNYPKDLAQARPTQIADLTALPLA